MARLRVEHRVSYLFAIRCWAMEENPRSNYAYSSERVGIISTFSRSRGSETAIEKRRYFDWTHFSGPGTKNAFLWLIWLLNGQSSALRALRLAFWWCLTVATENWTKGRFTDLNQTERRSLTLWSLWQITKVRSRVLLLMNASACWSIQRRSNWNVLRVRCVRFWVVDRRICEKKAYRHEKQTVMKRFNPTLHCHRRIEWKELSCSSLRMWFGSDEETFDSNCDQRYWGMFDRKNKRFATDCWWLYWLEFYRKLEEEAEESMALNSETLNWHRSQSRLNASMAKREKLHWMIMTKVDFRFRILKCMIIFHSVSLDHGSIVCWVSSSFDQIETIFLRNARSICAHWFLFSAERKRENLMDPLRLHRQTLLTQIILDLLEICEVQRERRGCLGTRENRCMNIDFIQL